MRKKNTLSKDSKAMGSKSIYDNSEDVIYEGNNCATSYWIRREGTEYIASGHIPSPYDELAKELKSNKANKT